VIGRKCLGHGILARSSGFLQPDRRIEPNTARNLHNAHLTR